MRAVGQAHTDDLACHGLEPCSGHADLRQRIVLGHVEAEGNHQRFCSEILNGLDAFPEPAEDFRFGCSRLKRQVQGRPLALAFAGFIGVAKVIGRIDIRIHMQGT